LRRRNSMYRDEEQASMRQCRQEAECHA